MATFPMTKYCPACQHTKDRNEFHNNKSHPDGKHDTCKPCRNKRQAELKQWRKEQGIPLAPSQTPERKKLNRQLQAEKIKQAAVETVIDNATKTGGYVPHTEDLLERVISLMGGTDVLAEKLAQHIEACQPGSQQQGKALDMMMRYLDKNTQRQIEQTTPIEQATIEDLERRLDEALGRNSLKIKRTEDDEQIA